MLTIGFIGNGKSANRYHMPFILQRPDKIKVKKNLHSSSRNRQMG